MSTAPKQAASLRHVRFAADENGLIMLAPKPQPLRPEPDTLETHSRSGRWRDRLAGMIDRLFSPSW